MNIPDQTKPILLETMDTPILGDYDIIVVGGGIAGVCAAVAAKRAGAERVLLLEKTVQLGGLATQGLISLYEPICDAHGKKLTYGMSSELIQLCRRYGPDDLPACWEGDPDFVENCTQKYWLHFSPAIVALALDEMVAAAKVELLLDTQVVKPVMDGHTVTALVVENKSGRGAYTLRSLIDVTGDGEILHKAGVPCVDGKNFMSYIAYTIDHESVKNAMETGNLLHVRQWTRIGAGPRGNGHPEGMPLVAGTTTQEITQYVLQGRKMLLDSLRNQDRFSRDISVLPSMAQLREVRHIHGKYTLCDADAKKEQPDSVGVLADFWRAGDWYELPYRTLYHPDFPNIWTAGRIAAATEWAWSVTRAIPGCACSGQAAGTAAALAIKLNKTNDTLPYQTLLEALTAQGVRAHV